jgi:hypothetical protein
MIAIDERVSPQTTSVLETKEATAPGTGEVTRASFEQTIAGSFTPTQALRSADSKTASVPALGEAQSANNSRQHPAGRATLARRLVYAPNGESVKDSSKLSTRSPARFAAPRPPANGSDRPDASSVRQPAMMSD